MNSGSDLHPAFCANSAVKRRRSRLLILLFINVCFPWWSRLKNRHFRFSKLRFLKSFIFLFWTTKRWSTLTKGRRKFPLIFRVNSYKELLPNSLWISKNIADAYYIY